MANPFNQTIRAALSRVVPESSTESREPSWQETGDGEWPGWYAVTDIAAASIGAAAAEIAELHNRSNAAANGQLAAQIDRRLASLWFDWSLRPQGWAVPNPWDTIAGDYPSADGWIKLHTNAPHHRQAALAALDLPDHATLAKADVAAKVREWKKDALESAVVAAGGCAAAMRSSEEWSMHQQGAAVAEEPLIHWQIDGEFNGSGTSQVSDQHHPLRGMRVLDLTRVLAGPVATRFLARFGAEVLRVDPPNWEEPGVIPDVTLGKRCTGLDLSVPAQRDKFESLLAGADLLVHGYRPGALDNLDYSRAQRLAINPRLLDVSLCAYGVTGPWAGRRGFDSLVQMSCGIANHGMQSAGNDKPTPLPVQALDHATGYLMAAAAVRALRVRETHGKIVSARLSLARTAALLMQSARNSEGRKFAAESEADLSPWVEQTAWGEARRIRFPATVSGTRQVWQTPAQPLRSAEPIWG